MKLLVEQDCTIEHDGKTFESEGAFVSDDYVIGYMGDKMSSLKTWHGDLITNNVKVTSQWRINSFCHPICTRLKPTLTENGLQVELWEME